MRDPAGNRSTWPLGCWNAWVAAPLDPVEAERRIHEAPVELHDRLRDHVRTVQAVRRHHDGLAVARAWQTHQKACQLPVCPECRRLASALRAVTDPAVSQETPAAPA